MEGVVTKQIIVKAMEDLPEDAGLEDATERLCFMCEVEKSLRQTEKERTISQEEAKAQLGMWMGDASHVWSWTR